MVMGVLAFLCIVPVLCTLASALIAALLGCQVDLVSAHPCIVGGRDIGHALLVLGMMGYGQFFTTPLLILLALVGVSVEVVRWVRLRFSGPASV
jgi:hypothetical protein